MQKYLDEVAPNDFDLYAYPGENIKKLCTRAGRKFYRSYHNSVIVMGGICSLTKRDKTTKITEVRTYDIDRAAKKFRKSATIGLNRFRHAHPNVPTVIVPVIGIDLAVYNRGPVETIEQCTLDQTVMAVNKVIIEINDKDIRIPWISKKVHHCRGNGKWTHRYQHLRDGCHFGRQLKQFVAKELAKCLTEI